MKKVNARITVHRAHFSALIPEDIWRAIRTLTPPDEKLAKAADARQEIDLRIGCAYTRFQTLLLRQSVPEIDSVVSYGPCQFPTLGFVVERYLQRHVYFALLLTSIMICRISCPNLSGRLLQPSNRFQLRKAVNPKIAKSSYIGNAIVYLMN